MRMGRFTPGFVIWWTAAIVLLIQTYLIVDAWWVGVGRLAPKPGREKFIFVVSLLTLAVVGIKNSVQETPIEKPTPDVPLDENV